MPVNHFNWLLLRYKRIGPQEVMRRKLLSTTISYHILGTSSQLNPELFQLLIECGTNLDRCTCSGFVYLLFLYCQYCFSNANKYHFSVVLALRLYCIFYPRNFYCEMRNNFTSNTNGHNKTIDRSVNGKNIYLQGEGEGRKLRANTTLCHVKLRLEAALQMVK